MNEYFPNYIVCLIKLFKYLLFAILTFLPISVMAVEIEEVSVENNDFYVVTVFRSENLSIYFKNSKGNLYSNFLRLEEELSSHNKKLMFAMNAGMFEPSRSPTGLLVVDGIELNQVNTNEFNPSSGSKGNFYVQPNGIFYKNRDGFNILVTSDYYAKEKEKPTFATQSGPIILLNGKLNNNLPRKNTSFARNAVCLISRDKVKFVVSKSRVTFLQLADFLKNKIDGRILNFV